MDLIKRALSFSVVGGIFYLLGLYLLHQAALDFSTTAAWLFRGILAFFVTLAIVRTKAVNDGILSLGDGFRVGLLTTVLLAIFIGVGTWLYCDYIYPTYTEDYEQEYRTLHHEKMMRKYIAETWKKDTITQGAQDTIQRGLDLNIEKYTGHLFTTKGQVQTSLMYSLFWGLLISITVVLLARNVKK